MTAKSPYSGFTKRYGVSYKNKRLGQVSDADGNMFCPSCMRRSSIEFIGEHVQHGLDGENKYHEFNVCTLCGYEFCLVIIRKDVVYGV